AFIALDKLGYTPAEEELPLLVRGLEEQNTDFAYRAATLLGRLGPPALPELTRHLSADFPDQARWCAAHGLGVMGPTAAPALPALAGLLAANSSDLRRTAIAAIGRVAAPAEAVRLLAPVLRARQGYVRSEALRVLAGLGADTAAALPELMELL